MLGKDHVQKKSVFSPLENKMYSCAHWVLVCFLFGWWQLNTSVLPALMVTLS